MFGNANICIAGASPKIVSFTPQLAFINFFLHFSRCCHRGTQCFHAFQPEHHFVYTQRGGFQGLHSTGVRNDSPPSSVDVHNKQQPRLSEARGLRGGQDPHLHYSSISLLVHDPQVRKSSGTSFRSLFCGVP